MNTRPQCPICEAGGKIHPIDGRITGAEPRRYLMLDDSPKTRRLMQQKTATPWRGDVRP